MKIVSARNSSHVLLEQRHLITEALEKGVREALLRHKERGLPVVIQRDGQIVSVPAEELLSA